jgi:hypothetical protein
MCEKKIDPTHHESSCQETTVVRKQRNRWLGLEFHPVFFLLLVTSILVAESTPVYNGIDLIRLVAASRISLRD